MLFAKLLLSPMPHAHIRSIDASRSARHARREGDPHRGRPSRARRRHDRPGPGDPGQQAGRARPHQRSGLSGRADSRRLRGRRIHLRRGHRKNQASITSACRTWSIRWSRCARADPTRASKATCGSGRSRRSGHGPATTASARASGAGAQVDRSGFRRSTRTASSPWARPPIEWSLRRLGSGPQERRPGAGRNLRHAQHQPSDARNAHRDGVLAERQGLRSLLHAEHRADRPRDRALAAHGSRATWS